MAKNNDALKKHHFWILFGLVPLLVLIAVFTVKSSVGGEIAKRVDDYEKAQKELASKLNPKPNKLIEEVEKQLGKVSDRKDVLWKTNWERQKDLFTWPSNSPLLKAIEKQQLKFGAPLPNDADQFGEFKKPEVYLAEYSTAELKGKVPAGMQGMADTVAPTRFNGGWQRVLRHVVAKGWGERVLNSDQIWLLMEDIWVQRSMLQAVRSVNDQMAEFQRVRFEKDGVPVDDPDPRAGVQNPLRRKFHSRIWDVELEVARNEENRPVLKGRLINHTDRLQLMGLNNTMTLRVWFQNPTDARGNPRKDVRSWDFKIGGEFLAGAGATKPDGKTRADILDIVPTNDHIIPAAYPIEEIAKVEQVFDSRTVPIRRIEALALGFRDSRFAASELFPPGFIKEDPAAAAATGTTAEGMGTGGPPGVSSGSPGPPAGIPGVPGLSGGEGGTSSMTATGSARGGGTLDSVVTANKKRYLDNQKEGGVKEVRRMPVAISVVVDQSYLQDVQLAFANSPLRFQITQVNWARFRDRLAGDGGTGGIDTSADPSGGIVTTGAFGGGGLGSSLMGPPRGGLRPPGIGPGPGMPPGGPVGPAGPPGTGAGYNPYGESGGTYGSGGLTVSESQLTSGLIELTIYGVVSLYEKYAPPGETPPADATTQNSGEPKKDGTEAKKDDGTEKKDAADMKESGTDKTDPKEKGPAGKDALPQDAKGPKSRRPNRRRPAAC
jgi:hypothetical protein